MHDSALADPDGSEPSRPPRPPEPPAEPDVPPMRLHVHYRADTGEVIGSEMTNTEPVPIAGFARIEVHAATPLHCGLRGWSHRVDLATGLLVEAAP